MAHKDQPIILEYYEQAGSTTATLEPPLLVGFSGFFFFFVHKVKLLFIDKLR